jgi:hypothetical protein
VDVIRHDYKTVQLITVVVKETKSIYDHLSGRRLFQLAASHALVQPMLHAAHSLARKQLQLFVGLGWWVTLLPFSAKLLHLAKLALGNGIVQPEGDEVRRAVLSPMRQMTDVYRERFVRIEPAKAWRWRQVPHGDHFQTVGCALHALGSAMMGRVGQRPGFPIERGG